MSTYQQSARRSPSSEQKPLSPTSQKAQAIWEKQNEIRMDKEPMLCLQAKTQIVAEGVLRYMGEYFRLPEREALGFVGGGEVEQVIDADRPVDWMQNAPGPREADRGKRATQGSRESGDPRTVIEQKSRQQKGAEEATKHQPQLDQTKEHGQPGGSALSSEEQMEGEDEDRDDSRSRSKKPRGGCMPEEREERGERREHRGEEREERWMQRLITEQQETIDTQSETIERLVKMVGEEEEDEERREGRRRRRRGERGERGGERERDS